MNMMKLSSLGTLRNGMNFGRTAIKNGYKIIGVADFANHVFPDLRSLNQIDSSVVSSDDLLKAGDILFVRSNGNKNLVGRSLFIKNIFEPICYSGFCIALRPDRGLICPEYLFYALRAPYCRRQYSYSQQTNITNLSQTVLGAVEVPIPKYATQVKLAKLFTDIDVKIELNTRIYSELESMAKTLYDYWFVQFDFPDENGRPYRTSGGAMEWNEKLKRKIPKGWKAGNLSNIANITMGQSPAGKSYNDSGEGITFYQGRTDFGIRFPTPRIYTTAPTRFAKKGDILLSVRAPVGALNIALEDCCIGRGLAALNSKIGSQLHLLYTLYGFQRYFSVMDGNGTTFGSITKDGLFEIKIAIPKSTQLDAFEKIVYQIERDIQFIEKETRELESLRDWLLPMLMNGQAVILDTDDRAHSKRITQDKTYYNQQFEKWLQNQGLAARGEVDLDTLRAIFDSMDDDDK